MIVHVFDKSGKEIRSVYVETTDDQRVVVEHGGEPVILDKAYGPLIACEVRVRLDHEAAEWVVEREALTRVPDTGPGPKGDDGMTTAAEWREVVRFRCQGDGEARLVEHDESTLIRCVFDAGKEVGIEPGDLSPVEVLKRMVWIIDQEHGGE